MVRTVQRSALLLLAVAVTVAWVAPKAHAQGPHPIVLLAKKLAKPVDFPGIDDPKVTLQEMLELLNHLYGLRFDVNEKAFQNEMGPGAAMVMSQSAGNDIFFVAAGDKSAPAGKPAPGGKSAPPGKPAPPAPPAANAPSGVMGSLVATNPIPKMSGVRLETVLKRILARVPTQSGATYVLRRDGIEITTSDAKRAEFRVAADHPVPVLPESGPPPDVPQPDIILVQAEFDKRPLDQAFRDLADATDSNVVLDGRAADKAKPVTATLINVPLDTAVEILANMSGLHVVPRDRVLYVTTKENADVMHKEMRDRVGATQTPNFGQPGGLGPMPFLPGQLPGIGPMRPGG